MNMLSKSYNDYVRHGVALSLGFLGAHRYSKNIYELLQTLLKDKVFHVR